MPPPRPTSITTPKPRGVFQAGWPLTMVGLDVGDKTLYGKPQLEQLQKTHGPQNDFIAGVFQFLLGLEVKYGSGGGTPMYDPLAVAQAIDSTMLTTVPMHVDVETRGDFDARRNRRQPPRRHRTQRPSRRSLRDRGPGHRPGQRSRGGQRRPREIFSAFQFAACW